MGPVDIRITYILFGIIRSLLTSMDITDVCPFSSFCADRERSGYTIHQDNSCCLPCSCSKNCQLIGNCCHDAETDSRLHQLYSCQFQRAIYNKYLSLHLASTENSLVRVITDCHDVGVDVSNETVSRCKKANTIDDLVFVTGKVSGITYLNKHCALCNGEDDVDVWNLFMVSRDVEVIFSKDASYKTRDEYLIETGSVMSIPPTDFAALSTYCPHPFRIFEDCNITSKWESYDKDIDDKCSTYNSLYYNQDEMRFYKNPFCSICNSSPRKTTTIKSCDIRWEEWYSRSGGQTFTTLIRVQKENDARLNAHQVCKSGETMNFLKGTCTKLLCPPGTVVKENYCEPLFEDDSNIVMFVTFQVVFEAPESQNRMDGRHLLKEFREEIVSKVKQREPECEYCDARFYIADGVLEFSISFYSLKGCSYLQYIKPIAMIYKTTPFRIVSDIFPGNITLYGFNTSGVLANEHGSPTFTDSNPLYFGDCIGVHFSEKIIHCPSILISAADIKHLSIDLEIKDEILDSGVDLGNGSLRVCLEEYNKIHMQLSNAFHAFDHYPSSVLVIIYVLYSLSKPLK